MEDDITNEVEGAYRDIASDYKTKVTSHDLDHRYIEKFLANFKVGQKILDVGAGTGTISHEMQRDHRLDVTAIDLSKEMVDIARENYPDLKVLKMDLRKLDFPDRYFDGEFANYSLIHVAESDVPATLNELSRVLKNGGYLYLALQEPITPMDKDGFYPVVYKPEVKMFLNLFTEKEISEHLVSCGFSLMSLERRPPVKEMEFPFNKLFITAQRV